MDRLQSGKEYGPYWGLDPSSSPEEQLASLAGYEGSLPRGTSILDTEAGKKLFADPRLRDYYLHYSSIPYGGLWEGQVQEPSFSIRAQRALAALSRRLGLGLSRY